MLGGWHKIRDVLRGDIAELWKIWYEKYLFDIADDEIYLPDFEVNQNSDEGAI